VQIPVPASDDARTCKLRIASDGLLGTTRLAFDRT
jgi:hypothetical protein